MINSKKISAVASLVKKSILNISGATAIEYALIAGLIFLAIVTALNFYAESLGNLYNDIGNNVRPSL